MEITKGKATATVGRTPRGDWSVAFGRFRAVLPAMGDECDAWFAAGKPREVDTAPGQVVAFAKDVLSRTRRHRPAAPWRGRYIGSPYVPLDGEETIALSPWKSRAHGTAPAEVVAGVVSCTSPRCRESGGNFTRLVIQLPGSLSYDPLLCMPSKCGEPWVDGRIIEERAPDDVLAEHQAWHRERFPASGRVELDRWIADNAHVAAPDLTEEQRAEIDAGLLIAATERNGGR